jgi:arylsulfatase A-like enzyme
MTNFSRRDFLKLTALVSAGTALTALRSRGLSLQKKKPNFIVLLADTMSASNLSLYGYGRRTTPNLERMAERAFVYHSHYSGGNYTTPGTASTLTGAYPWTHRAVNLGGLVLRQRVDQNIFHLLGSEYQRVGFSQNLWADVFLRQFGADIDLHIPSPTFIYGQEKLLVSHVFVNDQLGAGYALDDFLLSTQQVMNPLSGSAPLGYLSLFYGLSHQGLGTADEEHPYGLPSNGYYFFENSTLYDGMRQTVLDLHRGARPFFAYFHLMSPHSTYRPTREFVDSLAEIDIPNLPYHPLGARAKRRELLESRKVYDEYVANVDAEMGRLFDALEQAGVLDDTYFIITSDHGEMFERGVYGHDTPLLYDPVIHIPLLVCAPGQSTRTDIHMPTSNADLLPTLLSLAGRDIPADVEGILLPGLGGTEDAARPVFSMEAKESSSFQPFTRASFSITKGAKKLIYYKGYEKYPEAFELYDLQEDIQEKNDLYAQDTTTAASMKEELLDNLAQAERPFQRNQ